jgi:hypothetical protein
VSTELFSLFNEASFLHVGKVPGNFRAAQVVRCVSVSRTFQGEGSMGPVARDVVLPLSHLKHVLHPPQSGIEERRPDPTWTTNWHIGAKLKHHNPGRARAGRGLWGFGSLRPVSTELFLCSTSRFFHVGKVPGNFRAAQVVRCVSVPCTSDKGAFTASLDTLGQACSHETPSFTTHLLPIPCVLMQTPRLIDNCLLSLIMCAAPA